MSEECRLDDPTEEEMQALEKSNADKDTRIKELEEELALQESHYDCEVAKNKELEGERAYLVDMCRDYYKEVVEKNERIEELEDQLESEKGEES